MRLNHQSQKKLDRLASAVGVDVIDEVGAVPGPLLHADALRTTYGRALRHGLDGACHPAYPARQLDTAALRSNAELFTVREEPWDARAQGGNAGTGIRRRPAARNAEEGVRRLSRRTDAT